jgi:hypothetical protein
MCTVKAAMKEFSRRILSRLVRRDWCWRLLDLLLLRVARRAEYERQDVMFRRQIMAIVRSTFPDFVVRNGPFRGLLYPRVEAVCSAVLPKLLGSYERELHLAVERLCQRGYRVVIDIGCAEGYYAVGLARRLPTARVYAFDTDPRARTLCHEMAVRNSVADRVVIGGQCGPDDLRALVSGQPVLVICDCEGFERELLAPSVVPSLAGASLIVEAHDFVGVEIAGPLTDRFRETHDIELVASTDDDSKVRHYVYSEISGFDRATRKFILAERRPAVMEWLVMTPRNATAEPFPALSTMATHLVRGDERPATAKA